VCDKINIIIYGGAFCMSDFKKQIDQDIKEYQSRLKYVSNINKDEWAFNYWILDKLFYEDEELIEEKIIDYNDMSIDCYEIYEDTKDIYLIQNKYYNDNTKITAEYVKNDFLLRGINALKNGTYKRSSELQKAFTRLKNDPEFTVRLQLFVTNDCHNEEAEKYIREFNAKNKKCIANIFYLNDIKKRYYDEIEEIHTHITVKVESVVKGTILNINNYAYKLENVLDARYVLTPVVSIYRLYRESLEKQYPIFDKNIREYLGNKGINKGIYNTLQDVNDRKNFFYYNNGITIICDSMTKIETQPSDYNMNAKFYITNPQVVNGCQTVNSIYEYLQNVAPSELEREFKDTFVMLKILVINRDNDLESELYKNIVKYNNSQNKIDEKTFVANTSVFLRLQEEFEKKGFLLLIKQSDKNKFSKKYKTISKLKELSYTRFDMFGIDLPQKLESFYVPLDKLLQVINAFVSGGYIAYTKKSQMLKFDSKPYNTAVEFIKNDDVTIDLLLNLYMLYKRADQEKVKNDDSRVPIPYYLIDFFAKYECEDRNQSNIATQLDDIVKINHIIKCYTGVTKGYMNRYSNDYNVDYNKMIKQPVKYDIVDEIRKIAISMGF
jgi:hypothetical protein